MSAPTPVLHEVGRRLRVALLPGVQPIDVRARLDRIDGVESVRISESARSITIVHDGRRATRAQIVRTLPGLPAVPAAAPLVQRRERARLPVSTAAVAAALAATLPPAGRSAVAVGLVAARTLLRARESRDRNAVALDAISLATTALTGNPMTAATSIVLSTAAEQWRDELLAGTDELLAHLLPDEDAVYEVRRNGSTLQLTASEIAPNDRVRLSPGQVIPVDGVALARHDRVWAGERVGDASIELRAEQRAQRSRSARLRAHIRHALLARDRPGPLTPDLERMLALPLAGAGLVLALTMDASRMAAMLRADPQQDFALAHPVAREAALYAAARHGALLSGLDMVERLAAADTFAFQDIGVLSDGYWHIERIDRHDDVEPGEVERWLAELAGGDGPAALRAGIPDSRVEGWLDHGELFVDGKTVLHVGGSRVLAHTWKLPRASPDRHSLARTIGIVRDGRLVASVQLESRLRNGLAEALAALRTLGVKRIAVFTENPYPASAARLAAIGADAVVAGDRERQAAWLEAEVERGGRVALVHTSMRELLPAGGLSLCPVDAEAGAHGVLLGDPLPALLSARAVAQALRSRVRRQFGASMAFNAGLMVTISLGIIPPMAITVLKHAFSGWMLHRGTRLAETSITASHPS